MTSTFSSRIARLAKFFRHTPDASPIEQFVAERIKSPPGARLAVVTLWRSWQRHAAAHGLERGTLADLVSAVRRVHSEAKIVASRSGKDVHKGRHLTGLALR